MDNPNFHFEFQYNDETYIADIRHYEDLTEDEKVKHQVKENTFLVHLFSTKGAKTFEIFIEPGDFEMKWITHSSFVVDPQIVEIIGNRIDDKYM
jgi:hypothetical protein